MRSAIYLTRSCREGVETGRRISSIDFRTENRVIVKGSYLGNAVIQELRGTSQSQLRASEKSRESERV
jgi:hypothetical protein